MKDRRVQPGFQLRVINQVHDFANHPTHGLEGARGIRLQALETGGLIGEMWPSLVFFAPGRLNAFDTGGAGDERTNLDIGLGNDNGKERDVLGKCLPGNVTRIGP